MTIKKLRIFLNPSSLLAVFFFMALSSCGGKKTGDLMDLSQMFPPSIVEKLPDLLPETKEEPPRYFYPHAAKRDPFVPLIGGEAFSSASKGSGKDLAAGELSNLELKGILKDRRGKIAIITTTDGEPFVLRSGRIYDRKNRVVSGVSAIIKEKSVVLISKSRAITELSLKKKDEGTISVNSAQQ